MAVLGKLLDFFKKLASILTSGRAQKSLDVIFAHIPAALPYIDIAAQIITGITPTTLDDKAYSLIKARYPKLFDGSLQTGDEVKLYALGIAAELLAFRFPALSTTEARSAVQLAFIDRK